MKFATIALVASASAISLRADAEKVCVPHESAVRAFKMTDSSKNGQIDRKELVKGMEMFEKYSLKK